MAAKRQARRTDSDRALRDHLLELLGKGHAHVTFQDTIADWPPALRGPIFPPGPRPAPARPRGGRPSSSPPTFPITWDSSSCSGACSALGKGTRVTGESAAIRFASPIGELVITAGDAGLTGVWFPGVDLPGVQPDDGREPPSGLLSRAGDQLAEYFAGARTAFDLPLDPPGTAFQRRVWSALRAIPYGTTVSYSELARRLGDVRATRAVGAANGS